MLLDDGYKLLSDYDRIMKYRVLNDCICWWLNDWLNDWLNAES